ncbi:hypothetical protein KQX54_004981 [Cotesia glomerata]|uniref:Uncharacterized protein n=1 Tax=Cotesia glomerata TaxID=32391 RepID=A0AAV7I8A8_COTGL|nr:hypothetical protein KQX54_004981 [Cotesia glomerata]
MDGWMDDKLEFALGVTLIKIVMLTARYILSSFIYLLFEQKMFCSVFILHSGGFSHLVAKLIELKKLLNSFPSNLKLKKKTKFLEKRTVAPKQVPYKKHLHHPAIRHQISKLPQHPLFSPPPPYPATSSRFSVPELRWAERRPTSLTALYRRIFNFNIEFGNSGANWHELARQVNSSSPANLQLILSVTISVCAASVSENNTRAFTEDTVVSWFGDCRACPCPWTVASHLIRASGGSQVWLYYISPELVDTRTRER